MRRRRRTWENPVHIGPIPRLETRARLAIAVAVVVAMAKAAMATQGELCLEAAHRAARAHSVPAEVLVALTMTETATRRDGEPHPWPWAVNDGGTGHWFRSREAALQFARARLKEGARNFDVGCFQLNYRWHASAFASLEQMFDPVRNADYAARYLRSHYLATGDWSLAAGRYHSLTEKHASRYRQAFDAHRARLRNRDTRRADVAPAQHSVAGLAALAAPSGSSAPGSLVSLSSGAEPLLVGGRRLF